MAPPVPGPGLGAGPASRGLVALTKGGLVAATRSLAVEYAAYGIGVKCRLTGRHPDAGAPAGQLREPRRPAFPARPGRQVSDVVNGMLFPQSSPYIAGEVLPIDGGQIAGR